VTGLDRKVIRTIGVNEDRMKAHLTNSVALLTYLTAHIGHDLAADVYMKMKASGKSAREIIVGEGIMTPEKFDELTAPERISMAGYRP
jgi:aspartate ammonia-lyase